jgi:hypothetical protein
VQALARDRLVGPRADRHARVVQGPDGFVEFGEEGTRAPLLRWGSSRTTRTAGLLDRRSECGASYSLSERKNAGGLDAGPPWLAPDGGVGVQRVLIRFPRAFAGEVRYKGGTSRRSFIRTAGSGARLIERASIRIAVTV